MTDKLFQMLKQAYSPLGLADSILRGHAEALVATGLVTDENIADVVLKQKGYLESLQKYNDKRVNDALAKAQKEAVEKAQKEAEERAKKEADERERREREEAERVKKEQETKLPESVKAYLDSIQKTHEAEIQKMVEARNASDAEWQKKINDVLTVVDGFKAENAKYKSEEAKRQRSALILSKAKELGIPQYRIDEGFVISDDADETAIGNYLAGVAKNIKTSQLPGRGGFPLSDKELSKEDAGSIADAIISKR